jgi:hypothetical protein
MEVYLQRLWTQRLLMNNDPTMNIVANNLLTKSESQVNKILDLNFAKTR